MKDNIRKQVTAGFIAILGLMLLLAAVSLGQLHFISERLENLVAVNPHKTVAANELPSLELKKTEKALVDGRDQVASTAKFLFALTLLSLLVSALLARMIIRRVSEKSRQLAY